MNRNEIESSIMDGIKRPLEELIRESVEHLNLKGYDFRPAPSQTGVWIDSGMRLELDIHSALSVSCTELTAEESGLEDARQREIEDRFYEMAAQGADHQALTLASFEAEVANGGFEQLYLNKGASFISEALTLLQSIGARTKLELCRQALSLIESHSEAIARYTELQSKLSTLDDQFCSSDENIPVLYQEKLDNR